MDPKCKSSPICQKLEGRYANHFAVGYNACEFIFDFGQSYDENDEAELYTRVITSPAYAKTFFDMLKGSIEQYERTFGDIQNKCKL
jgi:hypothetical protein